MRSKSFFVLFYYPFIPCHRKYSQSECRKAVVYSSVLHRAFPSISAVQLYHTQPSHLATVFSMAWYKIVVEPFLVVKLWNIPLITCIFLVYTLAYRLVSRVYTRKLSDSWDVPRCTPRKRYITSINILRVPVGA